MVCGRKFHLQNFRSQTTMSKAKSPSQAFLQEFETNNCVKLVMSGIVKLITNKYTALDDSDPKKQYWIQTAKNIAGSEVQLTRLPPLTEKGIVNMQVIQTEQEERQVSNI